MRDLVPFVQLKKREKHPLRSDTFSGKLKWQTEACDFTKVSLLHGSFSRF